MARNTSVALSDQFNDFIEQQVGSGRYGSASEVVRAGLRLLQDRERRLDALREALIEGENSGPASPWDVEEFLRSVKAKARERKKCLAG